MYENGRLAGTLTAERPRTAAVEVKPGHVTFLGIVFFGSVLVVLIVWLVILPRATTLIDRAQAVADRLETLQKEVTGKLDSEQTKEIERLNKLNLARQSEMRQQLEIHKLNDKLLKKLREVE